MTKLTDDLISWYEVDKTENKERYKISKFVTDFETGKTIVHFHRIGEDDKVEYVLEKELFVSKFSFEIDQTGLLKKRIEDLEKVKKGE